MRRSVGRAPGRFSRSVPAATVLLAGPVVAGPALDRADRLRRRRPLAPRVELARRRRRADDRRRPRSGSSSASRSIRGYTSLDLLDGTGQAILVGAGTADPADPRTLVAPIPAGTAARRPTASTRSTGGPCRRRTATRPTASSRSGSATSRSTRARHGAAGTVELGRPPWRPCRRGRRRRDPGQGPGLRRLDARLRAGDPRLARPPTGARPDPARRRLRRGHRAGRRRRRAASCCWSSAPTRCPQRRGATGDRLPAGSRPTAGSASCSWRARSSASSAASSCCSSPGSAARPRDRGRDRRGRRARPRRAGPDRGRRPRVGVRVPGPRRSWTSSTWPPPASGSAGSSCSAALTDFGGGSRLEPGALRRVVPRFSALALVSVALIALTGIYADWVQTRDLLGFDSPYGINLLVKILVFVLALWPSALLNYLDGGRELGRRFGLSRRLLVELVLGRRGPGDHGQPHERFADRRRPTDRDRSRRASSVVSAEPATLALLPGRPGPNRFLAGLPTAAGRRARSSSSSSSGSTSTRVVAHDDAARTSRARPRPSSPTRRSRSRVTGTRRSSRPRPIGHRDRRASGSSSPSTTKGSPRGGPRRRSIRGWWSRSC